MTTRSPSEPRGPLRLVTGLDDTFLVMNEDVVSTLDYAAFLRHHRESGNLMTIAAHERRTRFEFGLLQVDDGGRVLGYREKPEILSP